MEKCSENILQIDGMNALKMACLKNKVDVVKFLLKRGVEVSKDDDIFLHHQFVILNTENRSGGTKICSKRIVESVVNLHTSETSTQQDACGVIFRNRGVNCVTIY